MNPSSITFNDKWENITHQYPDKYFDLIADDIPYGIGAGKMAFVEGAKSYVIQTNGTKLALPKKKQIKSDWDTNVPKQDYFDEVRRISKHQIIFGIDYANWDDVGTGRIVWDKCVAKGLSYAKTETAYCSFIDDTHEIKLLWSGMMQAGSLTNPTRQQANKKLNEKRIHPCHKPVLLYLLLFQFYQQRLGLFPKRIGDTHMGGGSSRIAAHKFGSDYIGIEAHQPYFIEEERRFSDYILPYQLQGKMFLGTVTV